MKTFKEKSNTVFFFSPQDSWKEDEASAQLDVRNIVEAEAGSKDGVPLRRPGLLQPDQVFSVQQDHLSSLQRQYVSRTPAWFRRGPLEPDGAFNASLFAYYRINPVLM